jgi:hypothetical protein
MGASAVQRSTFAFEHQQSHRSFLGSMSPLAGFSVLPYIGLDPFGQDGVSRLNHQTAHNDALTTLYSFSWTWWIPPGGTTPVPPPGLVPTNPPIGVNSAQNLIDITPWTRSRESRSWWLFANNMEHLTMQSVQDKSWVFPFG